MNALNQRVSDVLTARRAELVARMVEREFVRYPSLEARYGTTIRDRMLEDTGYHLAYLAQAVAAESADLFGDYIGWAKVMLSKRGVPSLFLSSLLESMKETLAAELIPELSQPACEYLEMTAQKVPLFSDEIPSFIQDGGPLATLAAEYLQALLKSERHVASKLILDAAQQGVPVGDLYLHIFERTQLEIGRLWQLNQISVAQEHYCTAATQLIMSQLYPNVFEGEKNSRTLVATCVSGDLHEIGARMVTDFFEMDGWKTIYLGANVPTPDVVQTVVEHQATVLGISATITYHLRAVVALIAAIRQTPACDGIVILVGGYPFKIDPELWRKVGADGSANDAQKAVALANRLTRQDAL